jgi:hypothetical protein
VPCRIWILRKAGTSDERGIQNDNTHTQYEDKFSYNVMSEEYHGDFREPAPAL